MDVKENNVGLYEPDEEEREKCQNGISCDFGICSECSIGSSEGRD